MNKTIFVSGIDTDSGKSYATGHFARQLMESGIKVITQKFVQTGNVGRSEDIEVHRQLMGIPMQQVDLDLTTAPVIFEYPASAQLAARLENRTIPIEAIDRATETLHQTYDVVLIEGAGGLMVPLTDDFLTIDYISSRKLPLVLVTNSRLGSINHTILSLEAVKNRGIQLERVFYNPYYDQPDGIIANDTRGFISRYLHRYFPGIEMQEIPNFRLE